MRFLVGLVAGIAVTLAGLMALGHYLAMDEGPAEPPRVPRL